MNTHGLVRLVTFLLLIATTLVFGISMQQAGALSSAKSVGDSTVSEVCADELLACNSDTTCFGCMNASRGMEFDECLPVEEREDFNYTSMLSNCALGIKAVCCAVEISEYECTRSGFYLEYVACGLLQFGCSAGDDLSCIEVSVDTWSRAARSEEGVGSIADSLTAANAVPFAVAFVFLAAGVCVGVLVRMKRRPDSGSSAKIT